MTDLSPVRDEARNDDGSLAAGTGLGVRPPIGLSPERGQPWGTASAAELERAVAASMRVMREQHRSVAAFARVLSQQVGRRGFVRQSIYDWERGASRVTAVVWISASLISGMTPDEALAAGWRRCLPAVDGQRGRQA